jgi:AcrR family transcriptional regulator
MATGAPAGNRGGAFELTDRGPPYYRPDSMSAIDAREKILETASRLFASHGYDSTSLALVARDAAVSKALIFWHFESKENLYEAVLERTIEPYRIDPAAIAGLGVSDQAEHLIDLYFEFVTRNVTSVRFFLGIFLREEKRADELFGTVLDLYGHYRELMASALRAGQAEGVVRPEIDPEVHAALILSSLNGVLVQALTGEARSVSPERLLAELKTTLVGGIRP